MEKEFLTKLEEILGMEKGSIVPNTNLPDELWDSLTILSVVAAIDSVYDKVVSVKLLSKCNNVQDILDLLKEVE